MATAHVPERVRDEVVGEGATKLTLTWPGSTPSWASHPSQSEPHHSPLRKPPILLAQQTTPERGLSRAEGRQSSVMLRPGAGE